IYLKTNAFETNERKKRKENAREKLPRCESTLTDMLMHVLEQYNKEFKKQMMIPEMTRFTLKDIAYICAGFRDRHNVEKRRPEDKKFRKGVTLQTCRDAFSHICNTIFERLLLY